MTDQSQPSEPSGQPTTCPSCGATVRADVPWCTQCYAPLRSERTPAPPGAAAVDQAGRTVDVGDPDSAGVDDATEPDAPHTDRADVERVADQMLAQLAVQRDDVHGLASRLPSTPAGRAALVAVVIVVGTALALLLMFLLGSLG